MTNVLYLNQKCQTLVDFGFDIKNDGISVIKCSENFALTTITAHF